MNDNDLNAIFDQAHAQGSNVIGSVLKTGYDKAGALLDGLTFGLGDELTATARGAMTGLQGGDLAAMRQSAQAEVAQQRADNRAYDAANPITSLVLKGIGAVPATLVGGAPAKGLGLLGRILNGAKVGGGFGAAYGFGSGDGLQDRYNKATEGGAIGLVTGGALSTGFEALGAALKSRVANRLYDALKLSSGERGALGSSSASRTAETLPELTPGEAVLLAKIEQANMPKESLASGIDELSGALLDGSPMLPAEAVDRPAMYAITKTVNQEPRAIEVSRPLLEARQKGTAARYDEALAPISPETSPLGAGQNLVRGVDDLRTALEGKRATATKPELEAAQAVTVDTNAGELADLMLVPEVGRATKRARDLGFTPSGEKIGDLAEGSFQQMKALDSALLGKAQEAAQAGDKPTAAAIGQLRSKLQAAMEEQGAPIKAYNEAFKANSKELNELFGYNGEVGLVSDIAKVGSVDADKAATQLFAKEPEQIAAVRDYMTANGQGEAFKSGIKSFLLKTVEEDKAGTQKAALKWLGSPANAKRLEEALKVFDGKFEGKMTVNNLMKFFERESKIAKGGAYFLGSPTAPELRNQGWLQEVASLIGGNPLALTGKAVEKLLKAMQKTDDKTIQDLAQVLFKPERGLEALTNIQKFTQIKGARDAAVNAGTRAATRTGTVLSLVDKKKK